MKKTKQSGWYETGTVFWKNWKRSPRIQKMYAVLLISWYQYYLWPLEYQGNVLEDTVSRWLFF